MDLVWCVLTWGCWSDPPYHGHHSAALCDVMEANLGNKTIHRTFSGVKLSDVTDVKLSVPGLQRSDP